MTAPYTARSYPVEIADEGQTWALRLYVAGSTAASRRALENLRRMCSEHLDGVCALEVVDLQEHPRRAIEHQILAVPALVRIRPEPVRKIVGDLAETRSILRALGLREV